MNILIFLKKIEYDYRGDTVTSSSDANKSPLVSSSKLPQAIRILNS
jgi:hypothetical protein